MPDLDVAQQERMGREHAAWLDVGDEFKKLGLDMDGRANDLYRSIVKWGEELAHLRIHGETRHATRALAEKRMLYRGRYERGEY